jgi:membrane-bound serine protease (ClpP class)
MWDGSAATRLHLTPPCASGLRQRGKGAAALNSQPKGNAPHAGSPTGVLLRIFLLAAVLLATLPARAQAVHVVGLEGAIGPGSAEFVSRSLERARQEGARLVVLRMDTPGGLDASMREIVKAILASDVPVATFVAPEGARAASAGAFIGYASHVLAMAPGTNIGAATPVALGGAPDKDGGKDAKGGGDAGAARAKAVNDAAAYLRSLAELRGRNAEWAEKAVREGASLAAPEALREKVIDILAPDLVALLAAIDGREVKTRAGDVRLELKGATIREVEPGWRTRLLSAIGNPSVALVLMMIGIYGLIFELASPGFGIAGTIGAICLLLGLFALQMLPISSAGLALILLGVALMVAEGFAPSFGILGAGGVIAFVLGGVMLVREEQVPGFELPLGLLAGLAVSSAVICVAAARFAVRSRRLPVRTGARAMVGTQARVLETDGRTGWAELHGERWKVRSSAAIAPGDAVRVTGISGLVLEVEPVSAAKGE